MTVKVRCYGHRGMRAFPTYLPKQYLADTELQLVQPYEWGTRLALADSGAAQATPAQAAPDQTTILHVEVESGKSIRYEVNPPNRPGGAVVAGDSSPLLTGSRDFDFGQGWTFSCIDATPFP